MNQEKKSEEKLKKWLKKLRDNKAGAIETKALKHGVTSASIGAIFAGQLKAHMNRRGTDWVVLPRRALPRLLSMKGVKQEPGKQPKIKAHVRRRIQAYGFKIFHRTKGYVEIQRIKPKKDPHL